MAFVYVLQSETTGKYYIGSTNNLNRRLGQHRNGQTRTTRVLNAYKLVYYEEYDSIDDARTRERKLKSYKSHKYIDWLILQTPQYT